VYLQPVSLDEFEKIYDILHENARWLTSRNIVQWPLDWLESQRQAIQQSVQSGGYSVIKIDNDIVAVVEIKSAPEAIWNNDTSPALYIHKLAISRTYTGQHLGKKIIHLIEMKALEQSIKLLRLDCVAHNTKLRQYYESCNFTCKNEIDVGEIVLALYEYEIFKGKSAR